MRLLAAITIQRFTRGFLVRLRISRLLRERIQAATVIQGYWRRYLRRTIVPKLLRSRKQAAATFIQRFVRGWKSFHQVDMERREKRLKENLEYFQKIKNFMEESAQVKIRYYWLKYKVSLCFSFSLVSSSQLSTLLSLDPSQNRNEYSMCYEIFENDSLFILSLNIQRHSLKRSVSKETSVNLFASECIQKEKTNIF